MTKCDFLFLGFGFCFCGDSPASTHSLDNTLYRIIFDLTEKRFRPY